MRDLDIIELEGKIHLQRREWWQLYKKGWHKHRNFFGELWWIRFNWDKF